jgi:spermidine synthase
VVSARLRELAWRHTPMGEISLRVRVEPTLGVEVYEVKLGEEFLMSSLFTVAEVELARLGLAAHTGTGPLDVVVGGLGLGFTAHAALAQARVGSLVVVEALADVVDWHRRDLVPGGARLVGDPRTTLLTGDFLALVAEGSGFDPADPVRRYDVVLLDVDHTPSHVLHPSHSGFYTPAGLARLRALLREGGVLAVWADTGPDEQFVAALRSVFEQVDAEQVRFDNPWTGGESSNWVYLGR